jgi:L-ribulose-5-phosphate 4-epimerase
VIKKLPSVVEQEGVIKYQLDFRSANLCNYPQIAELNSWRAILMKLALIGQDPLRYEGLGFGNISFRVKESPSFIITGTQTGTFSQLSKAHLSKVLSVDIDHNHLVAEGALKPSSEALTHAAVYRANKTAQSVVHVHSPEIWQKYSNLNLTAIKANIPYGTPEMAAAVTELMSDKKLKTQPIFVMLGHEDGVISFGHSITEASLLLIRIYADALRL